MPVALSIFLGVMLGLFFRGVVVKLTSPEQNSTRTLAEGLAKGMEKYNGGDTFEARRSLLKWYGLFIAGTFLVMGIDAAEQHNVDPAILGFFVFTLIDGWLYNRALKP